MERTKKDFIKELMFQAQDAIWKNELVIANAKAGNIDEKEIPKAELIIEKDTKYLEFLKSQLNNENNQ